MLAGSVDGLRKTSVGGTPVICPDKSLSNKQIIDELATKLGWVAGKEIEVFDLQGSLKELYPCE